MNSAVDKFIKSEKQWPKEIAALRAIALLTGLKEELKWRLPCYVDGDGNNIAIIQPFKSCLALMFFKGALLKDPKQLLVSNGPNSKSAMRLEFRSLADVTKLKPAIRAYVKQAVAIEKLGLKIATKKTPEALPAELRSALAKDEKLASAFRALTPGRQRAYGLFVSQAKQSATREARIKKCAPRILKGKGLRDL